MQGNELHWFVSQESWTKVAKATSRWRPIPVRSRDHGPFEDASASRVPRREGTRVRLRRGDKGIAFYAATEKSPSMVHAPRQIWFVATPGAELLDLSGPWEVLGHANDLLGWQAYTLQLVAPLGRDVQTRHGLVISGGRSLRSAQRLGTPDAVFITGSRPIVPLSPADARLVGWLKRHHAAIPKLVSICTGAFVLGEAGLLAGRRATTHWRYCADLARRFPETEVIDEGIFVRDGRIWTSAGITAGIDLTLAFLEEDHGRALAMSVARHLLLFLRRSGRQAQFSEVLKRQAREPAELRGLVSFVLEHLEESLPVERLAHGVGMSPRSFTRWCRSELGESPAAFVRRMRIEEVRRLLETTALPLKDIAVRTGIGDVSTLWRAFTQLLGVTPAEYRSRFSAGTSNRETEYLGSK